MRELSSVELDLIVGGYGEESGGGDGFDESVYAAQATVLEDGSYSLQGSEAEYSANIAAAEAETWCVNIDVVHHSDGRVDVTVKAADCS